MHGPGGEKLPAASYALHPNQKTGLFFAIGVGAIFFLVIYFLDTSGQTFVYQTPGGRPLDITGRRVNTDPGVGWSPKARASVSFHDAIVSFVDRCLFRRRNLAASNLTRR